MFILTRFNKAFVILIVFLSFALFSSQVVAISVVPFWAKSVTTGSNGSQFNSITVDSSGNIYAAGSIYGSGTYNFGNSVTVAGASSGWNVVLVKYDSNGNAQWAKSVTVGSSASQFNSVTVDSSGDIYAVGYITGTGTYGFSNGITIAGTYASGTNVVLVKYDNNGNVRWAESVTAGLNAAQFNSVTVDSSGNIYAAGYIWGSGAYGFGNDVTVVGSSPNYNNVVLVKYNSQGKAQWAKSVTVGTYFSQFNSVTVDSSGNIYAAGWIGGSDTSYGFGNSVAVAGVFNGYNAVLVKYDSQGNAQWAKSVTAGYSDSPFYSVTVDLNGNVYVAGYIYGSDTYSFGNGVTVAGTYKSGNNVLLVKYDSQGNAKWARSVIVGFNQSQFNSIIVDSSGNSYAAGYIYGSSSYSFGNGVTVAGTCSSGYPPYNVILVEYDSQGNAQWAKSVTAGSGTSQFNSITTTESRGDIYAAGAIYGTGIYGFGNGVTVAGTGSDNVVLVKYGDIAPTLTNVIKSTHENEELAFAMSDFSNSYNSTLGNGLSKVQIISLPANGVLELSDTPVMINQEIPANNLSSLTHTPNTGYIGADTFSWNGSDGVLYAINPANVSLTVADQPPTLGRMNKCMSNGNPLQFAPTDFSNSFSGFCGNSLSKVKITSLPPFGALSLQGSEVNLNQEITTANLQNLTFKPTSGWLGSTSFNWNGSDGYLYALNSTNVNVAVNDQYPTITNVAKSAYENNIITFTPVDFSNSFNGCCGNSLTKIKVVSLLANGVLKLGSAQVNLNQEILVSDLGNLTFTPTNGFVGSTSFNWLGSDGNIYAVNPAKVNITINDQPPSITSSSLSVATDSTLKFTKGVFTDQFHGYCGNSLAKIKITTIPANGILKLAGISVINNQEIAASDLDKLTYVSLADYIGTDSFSWQGSDGFLYSSSPAKVSIAISAGSKKPDSNWAESPEGIATIAGGVVGGTASVIGTVYTINKCKREGTFCFRRKGLEGDSSLRSE